MPYDIIILGGQSNAEGNGLGPTDRPFILDERILMMRDGGKYGYEQQEDGSMKYFVTEPYTYVTEIAKERNDGQNNYGMFALTFAKKYIEAGLLEDGRKLLIINGTSGGTGFAGKQWGIGNVLHERLIKMINEAKKDENDRFVAFLWHQGEHDAFENAEASAEKRREIYRADLTATVNAIRNETGENRLPFIAAEFVSEWKDKNTVACDAVIAATNDVCEKLGNGKVVMARDLKSNNQTVGNGDDIHFCRDALVTLGERYFDAYCEIKGLNK
ncbi:MAG: hypothetical protein IJ404_01065 [Clostridia bacterium]|nr:hypothetical protein [Clostridia bacterium]